MGETGFTTLDLKKFNKSKVYHYIYKEKTASKQQVVKDLKMGQSTVSKNLSLLEEEGLIERNGYFSSTGGRKANVYRIVPEFKVSIGVGLLKNLCHFTSVNLYGDVICTDTVALPYENTDSYYQQITDKIKEFIEKNQYQKSQILGISIASQGIVSSDNTTVTYGVIMDNTGMNVEEFSKYLPYSCRLEHDSKSAAFLELWNHPELDSAVILLLNRNFGGGIITNHRVHHGGFMHSGTIEHMCINPDGPLCYCGNRGCLEAYCSANALEQAAGLPIREFFPRLREEKSFKLTQIWEDYLNHLAFAIKNVNLVIDAPIILSGYLAPYFTAEDTEYLLKRINPATPFPLPQGQILLGTHGQYTPAIGAALYYIEQFLETV